MRGTDLLLKLQRRKAREEGRQEGIEKAIRILEQAGMSDEARLLREFNDWRP